MIISFFKIQIINKTNLIINKTKNLHNIINNNKLKKITINQ